MTDGSTVYYHVIDQRVNKQSYMTTVTDTVYRVSIGGKNTKKLFSLDTYITFVGCYGNKIYYMTGSGFGPLNSYHLKTKKQEVIYADKAYLGQQHKQYIYFQGAFGHGLYVYNAKTGRIKTICKTPWSGDLLEVVFRENSVYYVAAKSMKQHDNVTVMRCKLDGSGQTAVTKNFKVEMIEKFNKNSIIYFDKNGKMQKKEF